VCCIGLGRYLSWFQSFTDQNNIPVFSPALTDGSLGDMIYFHSLKNTLSADTPRSLSLDIVQDLVSINTIALRAYATGMIIVGGGLIKHHICNANLMRNGADYAVYINTSAEFDGSDAGASPDEAISWGKIRAGAQSVKVFLQCVDVNDRFIVMLQLRCH